MSHLSAIWASLPLAPWPGRWEVQGAGEPGSYVIVLSRQPRREVRISHEVRRAGQCLVLKDVRPDGYSELVGTVTVRPGQGGLTEAAWESYRLCLAHLVIRS